MGGIPKLTIELMQKIAFEKGGKCLSKTYKDTRTKLKWKCSKGHIWEAIPHHVKNGSWCPVCGIESIKSKQRGSLRDCLAIIRAKGGTCLTDVYENCKTKIRVRCSEGHEWDVQPIKLTSRGSWCPYCSTNAPCDINDLHTLAKKRGGKCLSNEYNPKTKILWECAEGHQWSASQSSVTRGSWCPRCSKHISEELCRIAFESIFKRTFVKARPKWFRNSKGNLMELDGYCEELGIAFEHQGLQHFQKIGFFQTGMPLKQRKADDLIKKKLCKKHGIHLIEIVQIGTQTPLDDLSKIITHKCRALGISVREMDSDTIPYEKAYTPHTKEMRSRVDAMVEVKGGKILSGHYLNQLSKFKIGCSCGHTWQITAAHILGGCWCPKCAREKVNNSRRLSIEHFQKIAQKRGGKCLSKEYKNTKDELLWECAEGHQWEAMPTNVKRGSWCPTCGGNRRLTIKEMQDLAKLRKGKCLSTEYTNSKTKLRWRCSKGHEWDAFPYSIKSGTWCPVCYANESLSRVKR